MYDDGYHDIVNIDISDVVIKQMKERNLTRPKMQWLTMDALQTKFEDETFDAIVDKSTLDAILCGDFSFYNAAKMLHEMQRIMKTGGHYISISYGKPETRVHHFTRKHLDFEISCFVLNSKYFQSSNLSNHMNEHYCYVCQKGKLADSKSSKHVDAVLNELYAQEVDEVQRWRK
jgi:ubiquinone/menaquinone biosynthesis C-methylase UbiE